MNFNLENTSSSTRTTGISENNDAILLEKVLIGIACIIVICLTLIGNTLVVSVIIRFKRLKNATNYILLSLAFADITVTFLVMIPAMIQDVIQKWVFSNLFCKFYNAFDITCCTASILHLLLVAIDRYIAIFKPLTYKNLVRKWHVFVGVVSVWTLSLCMSFIPIFLGLNLQTQSSKQEDLEMTTTQKPQNDVERCGLEVNTAYAIISSSLSFYIPLVIMTLVYLRIFFIAKRQAKAIAQIDQRAKTLTIEMNNPNFGQNAESSNRLSNTTNDLLNDSTLNKLLNENDETKYLDDKVDKKSRFLKLLKQIKVIEKKRSKDTKAIKTLGIIMGLFIICWLPFFIMYVSGPLTGYSFPLVADRIITWIGYVNSFLNPIIYALTNKDFRKSYITTLKSLSKKLCPLTIHKSLFGVHDDYFTANSNLKSNSRRSTNNQIQPSLKDRLCKLCVCSRKSSSSTTTNQNSQNNLNSVVKVDKNNEKNQNDASLKDCHLSDISENENSQLLNDLGANLYYIDNPDGSTDSLSQNKTVLKNNQNGDVNNSYKINRKSILVIKDESETIEPKNLTVHLDPNLGASSKFTKLIKRLSFKNSTNTPNKPRDRSRSNDIILFRI